MSEEIADAVRSRREELSISQRELARRAEIHGSYVSKIEKGEERPSAEMARTLAKALDTDPIQYVLAAGHVPDKLRKALLERKNLRTLLRLAAEGELSDETHNRLEELVEKEKQGTAKMVPIWPEEEGDPEDAD